MSSTESVPPSNGDIAQVFQRIADVLELQEENAFKVRAYRSAVETLRSLPEPVARTAAEGRLDDTPGFGEAIRGKIVASIERARRHADRMRIDTVLELAEGLVDLLRPRPEVERLDCAGSLRRGDENVGDLDLVAAPTDPQTTINAFVNLPQVDRVVTQGERMARVALHGGTEVDLKLAAPGEYGALLHHFTGSRAHSILLRRLAETRGLTVNEYGVFRGDEKLPLCDDEDAVYHALGLPPIPVPLREDRVEAEAALGGTLPRLIALADIRGDVHAHTTASDGTTGIEEMARAAKRHGYEYMAITDHSQGLTIANGLFVDSEVDIKADGTLDFHDDLLAEPDFVIASAHRHNNQDEAAQTRRLIRAIEHPHVDLAAHPSGRLLLKRDPHAVEWEAVFDAARRTNTALEINAAPERLDLNDVQARRGWVEAKGVLNTRPLAQFEAWLTR